MHTAYLLLGTNLGNRAANLDIAIQAIKSSVSSKMNCSSVYQTAAWGKTDQAAFLNQVCKIKTQLSANELLDAVLSIESEMGRIRFEKWGERLIDIDILLYNNEVINQKQLQVPHPEMHKRKFTMIPIVEIAADVMHPVLQLTMQQLLDQIDDDLEVQKIDLNAVTL